MTQNGTHKPTCNGVYKGRPGKGRVYTLGQRKACYAKHAMTEDNTFRYTPKPTKATPKPLERTWCKRCRADSRKRSRAKRLLQAKAVARQTRKEAKAQLDQALPKAEGKPRKAATAAALRKANKGSELEAEGAAQRADNRIGATPRKGKAKGKAAVAKAA